jgi:hypothetical protein
MKMQVEEISWDNDLEFESLYKVKITIDPRMFESDKLRNGYTYSCCSRSVDTGYLRERSKRRQ